ncbi:MAG: tetratricopeptide repeat protein [Spirochaetes bacterium]|nr:tetratricopeptide repeat protein [Spirochaetota bacterium]
MPATREKQQWFDRCVALEKEGKIDEAIDAYELLIAEFGGAKEIFINLGALYARKCRYDDALRSFMSALQHGEDCLTHYNIGAVLYRLRNFEKAIPHLRSAVNLNPQFVLAILVMGLCYSRINDVISARECFEKVLEFWPNNLVALTALALIHFQVQEFRKAMEYVDAVLRLDSANQEMQKFRAKILYRMKNYNEYVHAIKKIKNISREYLIFDEFVQTLPLDLFTDKYGNINQKIDQLKKEVHEKQDASRMISLSLCHLLKGETDEAIEWLVEASRRNVIH